MPNDRFLIDNCIVQIEEKLDWGPSDNWTNQEFESLSKQLSEVSKISISAKTIKRLFGKIEYKDAYNPQPNTKKALALFLGYTGWEDFRRQMQNVHAKDLILTDTSKQSIKTVPAKSFLRKLILFVAVILICMSTAVYFFTMYTSQERVSFKFKGKYLSGVIPHTVVFEYDIAKVKSDSVYIDFGNETHKLLPKDKNIITATYTRPDYYETKVKIDKETIRTIGVHALSNGWETYIHDNESYRKIKIKRSYLGILNVIPQDLTAIDTTRFFKIKFKNIRNFGIDGDNFIFATKAKTAPNYDADCRRITVRLQGEHGFFLFSFVQPGCFKQVELKFGEVAVSGEYHDLSAFQCDFKDWKIMKLAVKHKTAYIYLENKLIYKSSYRTSIGAIKGIHYTFNRDGAVDWVRMYNKDNVLAYQDDFE